MALRVGVFGAGGRMGSTVCAAVAADPDLELVAAADPHHDGLDLRQVTGLDLHLFVLADAEALAQAEPDVVVDFTHLDAAGHARMVDVTEKQPTVRAATAYGMVFCGEQVLEALTSDDVPKGDAFAVARIAGIQGAKKCAELLPLAHIIGVHGAAVDLELSVDEIEELGAGYTPHAIAGHR